MEYYCHRYKFGKPEVEFSTTTTKNGRKGGKSVQQWDAVITVGGRRIGMGAASNKKGAQVLSYLDVAQYLESCDAGLWGDFLENAKKDTSANLGLAPHLVFQLSETLNDEVQGLCGDIKHSQLYKNAPQPGAAAPEAQPMPGWTSRRAISSAEEIAAKSIALQDKLADYYSDPKLEKMRAQRQALPVTSKATDILAKIEVNDVTIVMAATGSGKTTQIPQLLFDDYINRGEGGKCNIICTQPRRLAAMSVAERVADERGDSLGKEIGYQVRFDVKLPQPNGSVTFCTTGIFLKRMQSSLGATADASAVAAMDQVTHIVVDEVHERDIDTDLLLVVLKRLLANRKARNIPIKIILMSATIDPSLFQSYFADSRGRLAPVAEIPGRTFPVTRHHLDEIVGELQTGLPTQMGGWVFKDKKVDEYLRKELSRDPAVFVKNTGITGGELEIPYPLVALTIAYVLQRSDDGHVLVFLPGWDEIKKVSEILLDSTGRFPLLGVKFNDASKFSVHYLHSTIPAAEQKEVFKPPPKGVRRIILATNIAETSVTIPDVVYVVDTARVKEKRYDPERHMSSLVSAWVGSSNLNQRAGRAGRHREGEYYGLLSEMRLKSLDPHQLVEMKRSDLSNVVMHVKVGSASCIIDSADLLGTPTR
jgi:small subunit ribosomal protein S24e